MELRTRISLFLVGIAMFAASALHAYSDAYTSEFVDTLIYPYLKVQNALAHDDLAAAQQGAEAYLTTMEAAPEGEGEELRAPARTLADASELKSARAAFLDLSTEFTQLVKHVGTSDHTAIYVAHCPMAFGGKGGDWVQADKEIANPYYGSRMFRCGGIQEQIAGESEGHEPEKSHDMHSGHDSMPGHAAADTYSPADLDAIHAGVPGYVAQTSTSKSTESTCGMACCATKD